ncbi:uncharacterized protein BYT42DRAFT_405498 [Radiomyces spectabilis]|uniref:uncharacterized protein n=1 Tax=Radiomyces spectabilis TaxID=64574 RepID=UPI00221F42AF|nr:uncharacterized protein BYT42DRAFT_405498 [Radiomyces spectabilis]KAI8374461.1 hypothetical protein BYT42DRAFT_405498 [Radiomyces spectabilis]
MQTELRILLETVRLVQDKTSFDENDDDNYPRPSIARADIDVEALLHITRFDSIPEDEKHMWQLLVLLQSSSNEFSSAYTNFKNWFFGIVMDEYYQTALEKAKQNRDEWAVPLAHLLYGHLSDAYYAAYDLGDPALASIISSLRISRQNQAAANQQLQKQSDGTFYQYSACHRKLWYIVCGELGYCSQEDFVVVRGLTWQETFALYLLSNHTVGNAIMRYEAAISKDPIDLYSLKTQKHTSKPPTSTTSSWWFWFLHLWYCQGESGPSTSASPLCGRSDASLMILWPLRFCWIIVTLLPSKLSLADGWFAKSVIIPLWCNLLQEFGLGILAAFCALIAPQRSKELIKSTLNACAWETPLEKELIRGLDPSLKKLISKEKRELLSDDLLSPEELSSREVIVQKAQKKFREKDYVEAAKLWIEAGEAVKATEIILYHLIPAMWQGLLGDQMTNIQILNVAQDPDIAFFIMLQQKLPLLASEAAASRSTSKRQEKLYATMIRWIRRLSAYRRPDRSLPEFDAFIRMTIGDIVCAGSQFKDIDKLNRLASLAAFSVNPEQLRQLADGYWHTYLLATD